MNDFKSNSTFFGYNGTDDAPIAIDAVAGTSSTTAYIVTGETLDVLPIKMHAANFEGEAAPSVRVAADDDALESYAAAADGGVEAIALPNTPAERARFIAEWAKKAAKKNKKGIMPLLLLPLAACGGGGGDSDTVVAISVAELNALDASTPGVIIETIAEGALSALVNLTNLNNNNELTITVTDTAAAATDLIIVDGATSLAIDATAVDSITGTAADVLAAILAPGIQTSTDYDVAISGDTTIATALLIEADTTGIITATITEDDLAALVTLVDGSGNNAFTITVAAGPADAGDLNTVDGITSVDVDAAAVTSVTGTLAELAALFDPASGVLLADDVAVSFDEVTVATAQDIADLNVVVEGTEGAVTGTMTGGAALLVGITANADTDADQALTLTVTDTATAAQAADIAAATSAPTVDFSAGGITDTLGNLVSTPGVVNPDVSDAVAKDADVNVSIAPAIDDASAQDVTDINALLAGTAGTVTATIDGDAEELSELTATAGDDGISALTIVVNDAATAAEGAAIADATDEATVDFSAAGIVDTLANLAPGGITADLDKVAAKDGDVAVEVTDDVLDGTDIANLNAVAFATDGIVSATLEDLLPNLALLDTAPTDAIDVTVTSTTNLAADLLVLDGKTSIAVDALAMDTIEGSAANIILVAQADGITVDADYDVNVTVGQATVAQHNTIDLVTSGVITAIITEGDLATLTTLTALNANSVLTITVTDTEALAADLTTVNGVTSVVVDATAVTDLTGGMDDVQSLFFSGGVDLSETVEVTITDVFVDAAEVNSLDAATSGTITITNSTDINGTAAEVEQAVTSDGVVTDDDYTVTLDAATASATDLLAIDGDTSGLINATAVTELTGSVADVDAVLAATGINMDASVPGNFDITIDDGQASIADLIDLDAATTGVITADVSDTSVAALLNLPDANGNNALSFSIADTSASAVDLTTLADLTSVPLDAASVTDITGSVAEISAALEDTGIANLSVTTATLSGPSEAASDVTGLAGDVPTVVAGNLDELTGTTEEIQVVLDAGNVSGLSGVTAVVSDTTDDATDLSDLLGSEVDAVDASTVTTLTGTVAEITAVMNNGAITKNDNVVAELTGTTEDAAGLSTLAGLVASVDASAVETLTGDVAEINIVLEDTSVTGLGDVDVTIDGDDVLIDAGSLQTLDDNTEGTVDADAIDGISGSASDVAAIYSSDGFSELGDDDIITITGTTADAADLNTIADALDAAGNIATLALTEITGDAADLAALYTNTEDFSDLGDEAVTVTSDTAAAADVNTVNGATTGVVNTVDNVETFTGGVSDIQDLQSAIAASEVTAISGYDITITDDAVDAAEITALSGIGSGRTTGQISVTAAEDITGTEAELLAFYEEVGDNVIQTSQDYDLMVEADGGVIEAANIVLFDGFTAGTITSDAVTINGNLEDLAAVFNSDQVMLAADIDVNFTVEVGVTPDDTANLDAVIAGTTGTINGSLFGSAANLATIDPIGDFDGVNIIFVLNAGEADASDINAIQAVSGTGDIVGSALTAINGAADEVVAALESLDTDPDLFNTDLGATVAEAADILAIALVNGDDLGGPDGVIDGSLITALNGTYEDIRDAKLELGANISDNYTITVEGPMTVAEFNELDADTTGIITATISDEDMATLLMITDNNDNSALTITVTDASVVATQLTTLDGQTTVTIDATAVTDLSGSVAQINAVLDAEGISNPTTMTATLVAGTEDATDLSDLLALDNVSVVNATAVTVLNGTATEVLAILSEANITDPTAATVTLDAGSEAAADLTSLFNDTSITAVDASAVTTLTGTVAEINAVLTEVGIANPTTMTAVISAGTEAAADLTRLLAEGNVTGVDASAVTTLTGSVAQINAVLTEVGITNPTETAVTVSAGTEAASNLTTLLAEDNVTSVDASAVTELTGTATQVLAVLSEGSITDPTAATATLAAGTEAASDLTLLFADGGITTVDATLVTALTGTVTEINAVLGEVGITDPTAMTAIVSEGTESAAGLTALLTDGSVTLVEASAVTTLTGTVAEINAVLVEGDITNPGTMAATISVGTEAATDLTALLGEGNVSSVDASAVTNLTGTVAAINAVLTEEGITNPTEMSATIAVGTEAAADLTALLDQDNVNVVNANAVTTLTGTYAEIDAVLTEGDITNPATMSATISEGAEEAADLTALLAQGNVTSVDATAVTSLTGTATEVLALLAEVNIIDPTTATVTLDAGTEAAANLTALLADGSITSIDASAVTSLTGTVAEINAVLTAGAIMNPTTMTATITVGTEAAADLTALLEQEIVTSVDATAVTTLTGTFAQIDAVLTDDGIGNPTMMTATISAGTEAAANLTALLGQTNVTGVDATLVTTLTGTVAEIDAVLDEGGIMNPTTMTATISEGTEAAADLTALLAEGNVTSVEASAVTTLTGTYAEVDAVLVEGGITTDDNYDAELSGNTAVADVTALNAVTTGVITATITETFMDDLLALSDGNGVNALTITVATPASLAAADLNTLDATTSVLIDATAATTITGEAEDVAIAAASEGIDLNGTYDVTLDAGTADAADLVIIDGDTTGTVDATAITDITGSAADAAAVIGSGSTGITTASDVNVVLTGDAIVGDLTDIGGATTGTVLADSITDEFSAIQSLASTESVIFQTATGTVTAIGSNGGETMNMAAVGTTVNDLVINGLAGDDFIVGSAGDDIISGGEATLALTDVDTLDGGLGNDTFVVSDIENNGLDRFFNFTTSTDAAEVVQGADTLQFSSSDLTDVAGFVSYQGIDGIFFGDGSVGFTLAGETPSAAGATFIFDDTSGELSFDADGDGGNAALTIGTFYGDDGITAITDFSASDLEILGAVLPV